MLSGNVLGGKIQSGKVRSGKCLKTLRVFLAQMDQDFVLSIESFTAYRTRRPNSVMNGTAMTVHIERSAKSLCASYYYTTPALKLEATTNSQSSELTL